MKKPLPAPRPASDWTALSARLEETRAKLDLQTSVTPEKRRRILDDRARLVASANSAAAPTGAQIDAVVFSLAHELYAIEFRFVREVNWLKDYALLPGAPPHVVGIINLRGQIVFLADLKRFFDLPDAGITNMNKVIVLRHPTIHLGLVVDEITGVRALPADSMQALLPTLTGVRARFSRGIADKGLVVLDGERLLDDPLLGVRELAAGTSAADGGE